jgi:type II secretory pathway component GspD/PulD (secretin)
MRIGNGTSRARAAYASTDVMAQTSIGNRRFFALALLGKPACWSVALAFVLAASVGVADTIHVIALRNRSAAEIEPMLRPLLRPDEGLSASGYQLLLRASESRRDEIRRIVATLDVALRQLTVTLRQTFTREEQHRRDAVSGEINVGGARIAVPPDRDNERNRNGDSLRYRTERRTSSTDETRTQVLRVQDGQRAFIRIGRSAPVAERIVVLTGRGSALAAQGIELRDVSTGFDVLPRIRGDVVQLEIAPRLEGPRDAGGAFRFQELQTTVTTRLGEWIDLSAVVGQRSEVNRAILESASSQTGERVGIELKVE